MIQTMSNPNDWLQFYHQNLPNQTLTPSFSESTTVTTTTATAAATMNSSPPTSSTNLGPDGRVSKPTRRRSRASRRNPTTLLNTDTTNFRAMVQQFTGGPAAPFAPSSTGLPNLMGFGLVPRPVPPPPLNPTMFHLQQLQQQQQQQQNLYQPQNQHYNMYRARTTQGGDDTFMSNPRPSNSGGVADVHEHHDHEHGGGEGGLFPSTSS
ncbi:VQ motif-containing protein 22-like [Lotus japonicus]|uniref:VQ motif-containing protein 22-like n=1 Tax=Lotus japonicus TaxID=34305 RepID=UPI00258F0113|nr:VQ motif-containing protein 22-like [Lotus japonicus]